MTGISWTPVVVIVLAVLALSLIVTSLAPHRPSGRSRSHDEQQ